MSDFDRVIRFTKNNVHSIAKKVNIEWDEDTDGSSVTFIDEAFPQFVRVGVDRLKDGKLDIVLFKKEVFTQHLLSLDKYKQSALNAEIEWKEDTTGDEFEIFYEHMFEMIKDYYSGEMTLYINAIDFIRDVMAIKEEKPNTEYCYSIFAVSPDGTETISEAQTKLEAHIQVRMFTRLLKDGNFNNVTSLDNIQSFDFDTL